MAAMRSRVVQMGVVAFAVLILTGCIPAAIAETPFQRNAGDAASLLSASALAIEQVHHGKLDSRYATASLALYRTHVSQLPSFEHLRGAPDRTTIDQLSDDLAQVAPILAAPCLEGSCDWEGQVRTLRAASRDFEQASQ